MTAGNLPNAPRRSVEDPHRAEHVVPVLADVGVLRVRRDDEEGLAGVRWRMNEERDAFRGPVLHRAEGIVEPVPIAEDPAPQTWKSAVAAATAEVSYATAVPDVLVQAYLVGIAPPVSRRCGCTWGEVDHHQPHDDRGYHTP